MRCRTETNPDLFFVSTNIQGKPLLAEIYVLTGFPHSQYRPILLKVGIQIPYLQSIPFSRWILTKLNWAAFSKDLDESIRWNPAKVKN